MAPKRRKGNSLSGLFRRGRDTLRPGARGEQHDDARSPSNVRDVSPAESRNTITQPATRSPRHSADCPPPAYEVGNPTLNEPAAPRSAETDRSLLIIPSNSHDECSALHTTTKPGAPSIGSRSHSGPAILYRPEAHAGDFSIATQHNDSRDPALENPIKLWDEAYDELKRLDPAIVEAYEKILSQDYETSPEEKRTQENVIEQDDWKIRRTQMERILQNILKDIPKPTGVKRIMTDAINVVLSLKEVISTSLQPVPIAALAWTGVCIGLQVIHCQDKYRFPALLTMRLPACIRHTRRTRSS